MEISVKKGSKKALAVLIIILTWFALMAQYWISFENRTASVWDTTITYFSYFTILSNTLVALYFTLLSWRNINTKKQSKINLKALTAITVYIAIVGIVYQIALRHIWDPQGLQKIVDELLHSVIPLLVLLYWILQQGHKELKYKDSFLWLLFPLLFLIYTVIRGHYTSFYPYPFLDVNVIGVNKVILNSLILTIVFLVFSIALIWINRIMHKKKTSRQQTNWQESG
ncbi:MAG: Pr6Pr family membrane protein [Chitinophagales bacterium]|nr:Pr6Pr family membrane protein [Chitinophagales bacterium]